MQHERVWGAGARAWDRIRNIWKKAGEQPTQEHSLEGLMCTGGSVRPGKSKQRVLSGCQPGLGAKKRKALPYRTSLRERSGRMCAGQAEKAETIVPAWDGGQRTVLSGGSAPILYHLPPWGLSSRQMLRS